MNTCGNCKTYVAPSSSQCCTLCAFRRKHSDFELVSTTRDGREIELFFTSKTHARGYKGEDRVIRVELAPDVRS